MAKPDLSHLRGMWKPLPKLEPLSKAEPSKPTGELYRFLVCRVSDSAAYGVVWDWSWFLARKRAEWFYRQERGAIQLLPAPLWRVERKWKALFSAKMIARRMGVRLVRLPQKMSRDLRAPTPKKKSRGRA